MFGKRILRKGEVLERLGIRKTTLHESFIKTGRLRLVKIGARAVGVIEDELDALIEEMRRERDRRPHAAGERRDADPDKAVQSERNYDLRRVLRSGGAEQSERARGLFSGSKSPTTMKSSARKKQAGSQQ
jgi:predicted DNA-binding transcriptional regulator AlpA